MTVRLISQSTISQDAPVPQGKVLQVVSATYAVETTTTSTSFVTTGLSATITPGATTSKILVLHTGAGGRDTTGGGNSVKFTLYRGDVATGTNLGSATDGLLSVYDDNTDGNRRLFTSLAMSVLDSPATTSSVTYTVAFRINTGVVGLAQENDTPSHLTLLEVAG